MGSLRDLQGVSGGYKPKDTEPVETSTKTVETKEVKSQDGSQDTSSNGFFDAVSSANDAINSFNTSAGEAIHGFMEPIVGFFGEDVAKSFTPELYSSGINALEYLIPGVGGVIGAIQSSPELYQAWSGKNADTGEDLSDQERFWSGVDGAVSTAIGFIPGVGSVGKLGKAATKTGSKAAKAGAKAGKEAAEAATKEAGSAAMQAAAEGSEVAGEAIAKQAAKTVAEKSGFKNAMSNAGSRIKQAVGDTPYTIRNKAVDLGLGTGLGVTNAMANGVDLGEAMTNAFTGEDASQDAFRLAAIMMSPGGRFAANANRRLRGKPLLPRRQYDPSLGALKALQFGNLADDMTSDQGE